MKPFFTLLLLSLLVSCNTIDSAKEKSNLIDEKTVLETSRYLHPASKVIRLNQLGYFPEEKKIATISGNNDITSISIIDLATGETCMKGKPTDKIFFPLSGDTIRQFDFSDFREPGVYQLQVDKNRYSNPFIIGEDIYDSALILVSKSYYFHRVGTDITKEYGGQWHRPAGHADTNVMFHPATGKTGTMASPGGWYDAGDFGKYVMNGAFSAGQLLHALETYPDLYPDGSLNIPESRNGINDLLDEIKYEADWIATMQDDDGGVFHKLTTKNFAGAIMPHEATEQRYIMPKSTASTFDFAAFLAKMARQYKKYDSNLAEAWLAQAQKAWQWGVQNPTEYFKNPAEVATGEYGDEDASQEQFWAAAELFVSTGEQTYLDYLSGNLPDLTYTYGDGWKSFMRYLGVFTLLDNEGSLPEAIAAQLKERLIASADDLTNRVQTFDYRQGVNDFQWGSNSDIQNVAFVIAEAYEIDPKPAYSDAVFSSLNYLFGHNATGYSMVTGLGDNPPMHIHHRASKADGIVEPVPGFVCGGPNYYKQDANDVNYPADAPPMKSYMDVWESYASNEVCLNWNSPLPYLLKFAINMQKYGR